MLQAGIFALDVLHFGFGGIADGIPAESFQDNTALLLRGELAAGKALDILDKLPGIFASGFSLPEVACGLLYHGLLLPLNHNLLVYQYWSKTPGVH